MMTLGRCSRPRRCNLDRRARAKARHKWTALTAAWLVFASLFVGAPHTRAESARKAQDALLGEWWTENREGRVKFVRASDGTYRGITTCCSHSPPDNEDPEFDIHNPNPALRRRSTVGIVIIWKLNFEDGKYLGGYVYNPRDGHTYRMKIEVVDRETIEVRGYVAMPLFGQTQTWKRARPAPVRTAPSIAARKPKTASR